MEWLGWRYQRARSAVAAPNDTLPLKHGKFARRIVLIGGAYGYQLGDGAIVVRDDDYFAMANLLDQGAELILGLGYRGCFHLAIIA